MGLNIYPIETTNFNSFAERKQLLLGLKFSIESILLSNIEEFDSATERKLECYTEKKMLLNQKHFFPKACISLIQINII